ncbi:transketolase [Candidatus Peregrinibacteria bacterium]|nr:transketolase [Candidatus Peregrinibacteria bacterium]
MNYQEYLTALRRKATEIRINTLKAISNAGSGHTGSSLSAVDILVALYYGENHEGPFMNIDPVKPGWEDQDYFVLSKGQAAPVLYSILVDLGYFDADELNFYKQMNSLLSVSPRSRIPGVAVSSGAPGQGLSSAVGLALALRMDRARNKVFTLIGDAEFATGDVWESLLYAGHNKLGNMVVIVDRNTIQLDGIVRNLNIADPIAEKFDAIGFRTINVFAGHDYDQLLDAFEKAISETRLPVAIVCKTVKGKGVDFAENKGFYHDTPLSEQELEEAIRSLTRYQESLSNIAGHYE